MEAMRAYIAESAAAADAEKARQQARETRTRRILAAAAAVFFAAAVFAGWQYFDADKARRAAVDAEKTAVEAKQDAEHQQKVAEEALQRAEDQRKQAQTTQSRFLTDLARQSYEDGDYGTALNLAVEALPGPSRSLTPRPYVPAAEAMLYQAVTAMREQHLLDAPGLQSAAFSSDGTRIVTASNDKTAQVWNAASGWMNARFEGHDGLISEAAFSPDGRRIVTASEDGTARVWEVPARENSTGLAWDVATVKEPRFTLAHDAGVSKALFSRDGTRIVTVAGKRAHVWNAKSGAPVAVLDRHTDGIHSIAFSPDGDRIVTASSDRTVRIWNPDTGGDLVLQHESPVASALFSPDGKTVVTAADNGWGLWSVVTGESLAWMSFSEPVNHAEFSPNGREVLVASDEKNSAIVFTVRDLRPGGRAPRVTVIHGGKVFHATFAPDGRTFATASEDKTVRISDTATGKLIATLIPQDGMAWRASFSPDSSRVVTAADNGIRVWNGTPGGALLTLGGHETSLRSAQFSGDQQRIVTLDQHGILKLWDPNGGKEIPLQADGANEIRAVATSPSDSRMAVIYADGHLKIKDVAAGADVLDLTKSGIAARNAVFARDGRRIAVVSPDGVHVLNAADGAELQVLKARVVKSAGFSPDGQKVVTASDDRTARIWDIASGSELRVLRHEGEVSTAAFSPDGQKIVTASNDRTARLWDATTGAELRTFRTPEGSVFTAEFSPKGERIVTASNDRTVRVWDAATGEEVAVLRTQPAAVDFSTAAYAPDGESIVTANWDGQARVWPAFTSTLQLIYHANKVKPRGLTESQRRQFFLSP
jgi:WD40 repeat protein